MDVTFYKFTKETRSTKRPSGGAAYTIKLKENSSIETPTFLINANPATLATYNYCKWLDNYYYITDVIMRNNNIAEIHCKKDSLATYRSEILASSQFVVRCTDSEVHDGRVDDPTYQVLREWVFLNKTADNPFNNYHSALIGIASGETNGMTGAINYYTLDMNDLKKLIKVLFTTLKFDWEDFAEDTPIEVINKYISQCIVAAGKMITNPIQYITNIQILPFEYWGSTGQTPSTLDIGPITLDLREMHILLHPINIKNIYTTSFTIELSDHPQAETYGTVLNNMPYTKRTLYFPPFGTFALDTSAIGTTDDGLLHLSIMSGVVDGMARLRIFTIQGGITNTLVETYAKLANEIQLIQLSLSGSEISSGISGTTSAMMEGASGNVAGAAISAVGARTSFMRSIYSPEIRSVGGTAGTYITVNNSTIRLENQFFTINPVNNNTGLMVCKNKTLSELTGSFVICEDAKIEISGHDSEAEEIKNILDSGIWLE